MKDGKDVGKFSFAFYNSKVGGRDISWLGGGSALIKRNENYFSPLILLPEASHKMPAVVFLCNGLNITVDM